MTGYELLYRAGDEDQASISDGEMATARVALNALTEIGLDRVVGQHAAWINVTREFLLQGLARSLPPKRVVLELLQHQLVDEQLLKLITELRQSGYVLALDHFSYSPEVDLSLRSLRSSSSTSSRSGRMAWHAKPTGSSRLG